MSTVTIPNRPVGGDARAIAAIIADFDAILAALNGNLQDDNLQSPSNNTWKTVFDRTRGFSAGGQPAGDLGIHQSGWSFLSGQAQAWDYFHLNVADFAVASKATKFRLRSFISNNGIDTGSSYVPKLFPITGFGGGSGNSTLTVGAAVLTVPSIDPTVSGSAFDVSPEAVLTTGPYIFGFTQTGTSAVNSNFTAHFQLQVRNN